MKMTHRLFSHDDEIIALGEAFVSRRMLQAGLDA
jgi:hypothetical protein